MPFDPSTKSTITIYRTTSKRLIVMHRGSLCAYKYEPLTPAQHPHACKPMLLWHLRKIKGIKGHCRENTSIPLLSLLQYYSNWDQSKSNSKITLFFHSSQRELVQVRTHTVTTIHHKATDYTMAAQTHIFMHIFTPQTASTAQQNKQKNKSTAH